MIPAGTFTMGSPETKDERDSDEGPQHAVSVRAVAMGKTEVMREQFAGYIKRGARVTASCYVLNTCLCPCS